MASTELASTLLCYLPSADGNAAVIAASLLLICNLRLHNSLK
jgi:hypothetical protein